MALPEDSLVSHGGSKQILFGRCHGVPGFQDFRANPATIRDEIIGWSGTGYKVVAKVGVQRMPKEPKSVGHSLTRLGTGF